MPRDDVNLNLGSIICIETVDIEAWSHMLGRYCVKMHGIIQKYTSIIQVLTLLAIERF